MSRLLFLRLRSEFGRHTGSGRDSGAVQPGGALAAAPVSTSVPWPAPANAPVSQTVARPSTMLPRPTQAPQVAGSAPVGSVPVTDTGPTAVTATERPGPVDYGRTVELPQEAVSQRA